MPDLEDLQYDVMMDEVENQMIKEYVTDDNVEEFNFNKNLEKVVDLYNIPDRINTFEYELTICKQLLKPIKFDFMPLQRQTLIFTNLVNIKWPKFNEINTKYKTDEYYKSFYYEILECAFDKNLINEYKVLNISPLIPKKHYIKKINEIYAQSPIKTLQIPLENSTEYLQELFDIWIEHIVFEKTPYTIAEEFISDNGNKTYDKTQILRKIKSIKKLLK
jgi:hypothetical protein